MNQIPAPVPSAFTCDTFAPHVGEPFLLSMRDNGSITLELISAEPKRLQAYDGRAVGKSGAVRRDPFALLFRGPEEYMLRQGPYAFQHGVIGNFELFIVPVGPGETGWLYEAVFN